jgi:flagellar basal body-associated protein FliL
MVLVEVLIGIGLVCVMVVVARIAYWVGKKVEKRELESKNV